MHVECGPTLRKRSANSSQAFCWGTLGEHVIEMHVQVMPLWGRLPGGKKYDNICSLPIVLPSGDMHMLGERYERVESFVPKNMYVVVGQAFSQELSGTLLENAGRDIWTFVCCGCVILGVF